MTANTLGQPRVAQSPIALSPWSTIAGAVMSIVLGIPLASFQDPVSPPWWIAALNAISHLLLIAGVVGLARAGAAGRSRLASAGVGLTLLGLAVLTVAEAISLIDMDVAVLFYSSATLLMMLGLILLGVAVLRAGRWGGWRRFNPLACGLYIPLVLLPSFALPGYASSYAIGVWGGCWLLVGVSQLAEATRGA